MAISEERLRAESTIIATPLDAGLEMTIKVKAYDKGIVEVDGVPMNDAGWLGAAVVVAQKVEFLSRELRARSVNRR